MRISPLTYKPVSYSIGNSQNSIKKFDMIFTRKPIQLFPLYHVVKYFFPKRKSVVTLYCSLPTKTKLTSKESRCYGPLLSMAAKGHFYLSAIIVKRIVLDQQTLLSHQPGPWRIQRHTLQQKAQRKFKNLDSNSLSLIGCVCLIKYIAD